MNNVSPINKAQRLTEAEVHAAAKELQEAGNKISSIELYKHLGRGSLTTISNFLKTWNQAEEKTSALPALVTLPESLKLASDQLIIKLWAESHKLAESELQSHREALRQAEAMANEKIEEAQAFSDEQAKQIDDLKLQIEILKNEIDESREELNKAKKDETIYEQRFIETEKQLKKANEEITRLNQEKQREIDVARKLERELQADITNKQIENGILKEKLSALLKVDEANIEEIKKLIKINEKQKEEYENKIKNIEEKHKDNVSEIRKIRDKAIKERDEAIKKAAILEGNLETWKQIEFKEESKKAIKPKKDVFKQVDVTDIVN